MILGNWVVLKCLVEAQCVVLDFPPLLLVVAEKGPIAVGEDLQGYVYQADFLGRVKRDRPNHGCMALFHPNFRSFQRSNSNTLYRIYQNPAIGKVSGWLIQVPKVAWLRACGGFRVEEYCDMARRSHFEMRIMNRFSPFLAAPSRLISHAI